jgi:hypothetical protein
MAGLSKTSLQDFVKWQQTKWPVAEHGKFTNKMNMTVMQAVLLNSAFGFTIRT